MSCNILLQRLGVWASSIAFGLNIKSLLGHNGLQGDDCVSTGEHVVEGCPSQGHICILYAEVDHQMFGSMFSLTGY